MPGVWVFPGGAVDEDDGEGERRATASARSGSWRRRRGSRSSPRELVPYSRWITPRVVPIRFDTRFYLALAPAHSPPRAGRLARPSTPAGSRPRTPSTRTREGELPLVFPTIKHLESLLPYANADRGAGGGAPPAQVKPVEPEVVGEGDDRRIVLPDDLPWSAPPSGPRPDLSGAMTSSLPPEVREAFDRFITCELTTVGAASSRSPGRSPPTTSRGPPTIDVTTGLGYPKKADDASATPASRCCSPTRPAPGSRAASGARPGDRRGRRPQPGGQPGALLARVVARSCRHPEDAPAQGSPRRMSAGTTRASTSMSGPSASSSGRTATSAAEPVLHDAHLEEVRSGHSEEPPEEHGPAIGGEAAWDERIDELGREHETGVSAGSPPTASRSRCGSRRGPSPPRARSSSAASRRACRCSRAAPASPSTVMPRLHLAARTSRSGATSSAARAAGASSRRKLVGGFELPEERDRPHPAHLAQGDPLLPHAARRLQGRCRLAGGERLQAGVPGARPVGVDAVLLHLALEALEDPARRLQRLLQLLAVRSRRRQRKKSWRSVMPKSISAGSASSSRGSRG